MRAQKLISNTVRIGMNDKMERMRRKLVPGSIYTVSVRTSEGMDYELLRCVEHYPFGVLFESARYIRQFLNYAEAVERVRL